jgi:cobalt/nickel transport system permease protein
VRLAAALGAWAVALGAPHPATALSIATLALALRLTRPRPLRALLPALALAAIAALLVSLVGGGRVPAALLFARIVAAGWIGAALVAWLPTSELLAALAWARVSPTLLELLALAERQRHALADHALSILHAQRLRLGWTRPPRALRSAGTLAGLAVWRAVAQAELASDALSLRGARGLLQPPLEPRPGWRNAAFAAGAATALCACLLLPGLLRA